MILAAACMAVSAQNTGKPRRQSMQWFESVKSPEINENGDVTFRLFAPKAEKVLLSCQACPTTPMTWDDDDQAWKVTIHPQVADIYPYNFIVDGTAVSDPANKELFPNELFKSSLLIMPNPDMPYTERNIPHGQVHYLTYYSTVMDETRTLLVYTPADYGKDAKRKYPVYYLVSGTTDTEETWYKAGRANFILDNLIHDGKANEMIVVMPYGNMNTGNPRPESNAAGSTYDLFSQEMEQCIMPLVEQSFRTRNERDGRAIGGFSRGAGEALYTAFKLPGRFASVCAYSGFLTHELYEQQFPQLIGNPAKTNSDYRLIWFGIGTDDFLLEGVRKNKELFKQRGVHFEEFETTGGHTWMNARKFLHMTAQKLFR